MRSTPHINPTAPIAPTILLPGDPLRAKFIAETYLEDAQQFNAVRNMLGYTGTYRGTPVSVMGSGMGIPSISLYAHELIHEFGCTRLVRVGTCGALQPDVNLYDVVRRAREADVPIHVGNILSSDTFYNANPTFNEAWQRMGVLAVEMESAGLYATAAHAGVEAVGIFTVSDSLVTGEATDAQARQTSFTTMMELALPLAQL